jgi:hypothetical protein
MSGTKEFKAYGTYEPTVRKMVNNNNVNTCTIFFNSEVDLVKPFELNFFEALKKYTDQGLTSGIIPCFIDLWDMEANQFATKHAVLLIFDRKQIFLYDPNGGVYDKKIKKYPHTPSRYLYFNSDTGDIYTSVLIEKIYNIKTSKGLGIQSTAPSVCPSDTNYIGDGGYCMFYVRQALDIFIKEYMKDNKVNLTNIAKRLSNIEGEGTDLFTTGTNLEEYSVSLAKAHLAPPNNRGGKRSLRKKKRSKKLIKILKS